jgi:hypothetical protein
MAFAPLDVWCRLLFRPRPAVPPRYWPRVLVGLLISTVITLLTLPERLLVGLWLRLRRPRQLPGPVVILGYYRSGTTHLQFLLDRDPSLVSPKWFQALSPQGFLCSWSLLRYAMLPFLSGKRPQDNVAFGADVPAEDDFALNNGALVSTLPGRIMVPRLHAFYDRFHDLRGLRPAERARWARCQLGFVRKLSLLAGRRRVLLKTPSHTARVEALLELFAGTTGPKFIHISRHPHSVLRSNISMLQLLNGMYGLQDPLPPAELEQYLLNEYLATEQDYLRARSLIAPGQVAEVRLQDLQADPVGEIKRVYAELDLPYTEAFEQGLLEYLGATRDYKPNTHAAWTGEQADRLAPALAPLVKAFRHDQAAVPRKDPPAPAVMAPPVRRVRVALAVALAVGTGALCLLVWLGVAWLLKYRGSFLAWPTGIAVGTVVVRSVRRGSPRLGAWSAVITLLTIFGGTALARWVVSAPPRPVPFWANPATLLALLWCFMGLMTAFRIASQRWVSTGGRSMGRTAAGQPALSEGREVGSMRTTRSLSTR